MTLSRSACILLLLCLALLPGCKGDGGGKLSIHSQDDSGGQLVGGFGTGVYSFDDKNNLTVVLFDGPEDNPTQAVVLRMFWKPRAARTPIDKTATNATIHYLIFTGEKNQLAGVYSGAGFLYPKQKPGGAMLDASVWQASLRLTDKTNGFDDRLGQAMVKGGFSARRDDPAVQQSIRRLNIMVRERLGYPRLVDQTNPDPTQEASHAANRMVRDDLNDGVGAANGTDADGM
ncbi:MAG: hypothetical protein K8S99_17525 [Planctomycetes bacterium]|nr:hypothetical protein [Planctomycetota bacterium]